MMRQHEDGRVIRRLVAPPALPALIRPGTADRTEHVAPENPGSDPLEALLRHGVVDSALTVALSIHRAPHARVEEPLHQFRAPYAERILEILVRPCAVAIEGDREALDAEFGHAVQRFAGLDRHCHRYTNPTTITTDSSCQSDHKRRCRYRSGDST